MNLNIAICDDDTNDIAIIKKNILQYTIETDNNIVVSSYFSSDLLSDYKNHLYQIVLLDIEMPDINGMELAKQLRDMDDDLFIVFTTSYPEYMYESFEVQPFQFITKPIDYTAISKLFNDIIKKINRNSKSIVIIDTDGEKNFVPLNDLLYISSMKENKSHLRYQLTDSSLISKGTLSEVENLLSARGFVSPSRGFLVNLHQIRSINSTRLLLNNGIELPISRRRSRNYKISTLSTLLIYYKFKETSL